jgi:hypothetical protein
MGTVGTLGLDIRMAFLEFADRNQFGIFPEFGITAIAIFAIHYTVL